MAEKRPYETMEIVLQEANKLTRAKILPNETFKVGRSYRADYQVEDTGVSNIHVELKLHANDDGGGWLLVKDTSSNGTGLIDKGRSARTAIALPRGEWRPVQPGQGLLIPLWEPGVVMMGRKDTIIWLEKAGKPPRRRIP